VTDEPGSNGNWKYKRKPTPPDVGDEVRWKRSLLFYGADMQAV
jgi:hypothetical protein